MNLRGHSGRFVTVIILAVAMLSASGCVNFRKLDITSFKVNTISPEGFRAMKAVATVGIDNQSRGFRIFDIEGNIRRESQVLGNFTIDPVSIAARDEDEYTFKGKLSLGDGVSTLELLSLIPKFNASEYRVDLSFKVKPKGGAVQKMKFRDIPAENLIRMLR